MPLPKNIDAYDDIARVLNAAKRHGGGTVKFTDRKSATIWRARAYMYRALLLRKAELATRGYDFEPSTVYDSMRILDKNPKGKDLPTYTLNITFAPLSPPEFVSSHGDIIPVIEVPANDLEEAAAAFLERLDNDN